MLLGSTRHPQCSSPFLSTLGPAVGSSAAVPRAPPAPLVTGHRLAKLLVTFSASGSFLIGAVSAERSERQSTGRNSHDYSRAFFFLLAPAWTAIHGAGTAHAAAGSPQKPLLSLQQRQASHLYLESLGECKCAALQLQTSCSIQC